MRKNENEWKKLFEDQPFDGMYELDKRGILRNIKSKKVHNPEGLSYRIYIGGVRYTVGTINNLRWKYFKGEITGELYLLGWKKLNKVYDNVPDYYFVNINGDVFDVKNQRFREWSNGKDNYQIMTIQHNNLYTCISKHRTIGLLFIPNPDNKPTIDHIDRDPLNNNISNLRWANTSEQMLNRDIDKEFFSEIGKKGANKRWSSHK